MNRKQALKFGKKNSGQFLFKDSFCLNGKLYTYSYITLDEYKMVLPVCMVEVQGLIVIKK